MADEAFVTLLKERGVEEWNRWRELNPQHQLNFRNANFVGADLKGVNFSDADLRGADFSGGNLSKANLSGTLLFGAKFAKSFKIESEDSEPGAREIRVELDN